MKKNLGLFLIALLAIGCTSKKEFKVAGTVGENVKEVFFVELGAREADTIKVENKTFSLTGAVDGDKIGVFYINHKPYPVILDATKITLDAVNNKIEGSELNNKFVACTQELENVMSERQTIFKEYQDLMKKYREEKKEMPDTCLQKIRTKFSMIADKGNSLVKKIVEENQDNIIPAYFLMLNRSAFSKDEIIKYCSSDKPYMKVAGMQKMADLAAAYAAVAPGKQFIDLELNDVDGKAHKLSEFVGKGNYVLIDFWASWCGPCRQEMPNVKKAYEKFHKKGFDIVGLSFDTKKEAWVNSIKELGITWTQLSDLKGWESLAAKKYGINGIPATVLVGPDGKIVVNGLRGEKLIEKLEEIFKDK